MLVHTPHIVFYHDREGNSVSIARLIPGTHPSIKEFVPGRWVIFDNVWDRLAKTHEDFIEELKDWVSGQSETSWTEALANKLYKTDPCPITQEEKRA